MPAPKGPLPAAISTDRSNTLAKSYSRPETGIADQLGEFIERYGDSHHSYRGRNAKEKVAVPVIRNSIAGIYRHLGRTPPERGSSFGAKRPRGQNKRCLLFTGHRTSGHHCGASEHSPRTQPAMRGSGRSREPRPTKGIRSGRHPHIARDQ